MPINIYPTTTGGTKQYTAEQPIQYHAFEYSENNLNNAIYADQSNSPVAAGTATLTERRIGKPPRADKFNFVYNPLQPTLRPLVGQDRNYTRAVTTAVSSGVRIAGTFNLSNDSWFAVVVSNTQASRAMRLRVVEGSNSEVFAFTTGSVANTWQIFKFQRGTGTLTGSPNYSAITAIEVIEDLTNATFDFAGFFSAPEEINFVGEEIIILPISVATMGVTYTVDQAELLVRQIVKAKTATKKSLTLEMESQQTNLQGRAAAAGQSIQFGSVVRTGQVGSYVVPTNGIITGVPSGVNIASVAIEGAALQRSALSTNINSGYYAYSGSTITVSAEYAGRTIDVLRWESVNSNFIRDEGLKTGYVGYMLIPRQTDSGNYRYMCLPKVQMLGSTESAGDYDTIKTSLSALAGVKDSLYIEYEI